MPPSPLSRFLPLLLAALLPCTATATAVPDAAAFFKTPHIDHVELSPKGGYVAVLTALPGGTAGLVVYETADPSKFSIVIKTSVNENITSVHWVNEQRIGFTVKNLRKEFEGNLDEMAADRDGSNLIHLISGSWQHQQEVTGSFIKNRKLSADYAYYGETHDGSDDILVEHYTWNGVDKAPDHSRLQRLNTRSYQLSSTFEGKQPDAVRGWLTDARDVPRVATSVRQGRCIISYRKDSDTSWTELSNNNCLQDERFAPLFLDGDETLYVQASHKGYGALFRYDLRKMKLASEPFISVPGFDFSGSPEIDGPSGKLLGIHMQTDAGTTYWLDPALKADQAKIDAALPATTNTIHCPQSCLSSPVLLVVSSSDRQPDQYILYTRASGKLAGLGGQHPDIDPQQMGMRDLHRYKARDGREIPAYVTLPPGKADGPRPAIVLTHGGPYVRGGYWDWGRRGAVPGLARLRGDPARLSRQHRLRLRALQGRLEAMGRQHAGRPGRRGAVGGQAGLGRSQAHRHHGRQLRRLRHADGLDQASRDLPLRRRMGRRDRHQSDVHLGAIGRVGGKPELQHAHAGRRPATRCRAVPHQLAPAARGGTQATAADGARLRRPPRPAGARRPLPQRGQAAQR